MILFALSSMSCFDADTTKMKIAVIIATYNRKHVLTRSLPTLLGQDLASDDYELLVVVDGSTDGTVEYLRSLKPRCRLRVLEQSNRGQAAAINTGLHAASGEIILFLDDDILCPPNLLRTHVAAHSDATTALVYGSVLLDPQTPEGVARDWAYTFCDKFFAKLTSENAHRGWKLCMASANSSAPRNVLLSSGGLDETFAQCNDFEFGLRLWKSGLRFRYEPKAIVHQLFTKTSSEIIRDARDDGRASVRLCRKHPDYRSSALISHLCSGPIWKRFVVNLALALPYSLESLLRPASWMLERLRSIGLCRQIAVRVLNTRRALESLDGARELVGSRKAVLREFGVRLPVLMYHNIGTQDPGSNPHLTISMPKFKRHLEWIARHGYITITASQWVAWCREGKSLPEKPVMLTFDDAYRETAKNAFPMLRRLGFTGTVFVVTSEISGTNTWDQANGIAEQHLMSAEEIVYWANRGIEFGAHSQTHPDLCSKNSSDVVAEMLASRDKLSEVVERPVTAFAYPYGLHNDSVVACARDAFSIGFTCNTGMNDIRTDLLRQKRGDVIPTHSFADPFFHVLIGYNPFIMCRIRFGRWRRDITAWAARLIQFRAVDVDR
jgi:GT2 family glycosyltransferase/peptidoglycan/xylan/chitin deacetylase (PgdA/CDA1 family)